MNATIPSKHLLRKASVLIALFGPALLLFYAVAGHRVIRALYESDLPLVRGLLMRGKTVTPLAVYYWAGDDLVPKLAIGLVVAGLLSWLFEASALKGSSRS